MRVGIRLLVQLSAAFVVVASLAACEPAPQRAEFHVVGPGGDFDANPGDRDCADGSGVCSLAAALQEASTIGGADIFVPAGSYGTIGMTLAGDIRINPDEPREVSADLGLTVNGHLVLNGVDVNYSEMVVNGSLHAIRTKLRGSSSNPAPLTVLPGGGVVLEDSIVTSPSQALISGGNVVALRSTFFSSGTLTAVIDGSQDATTTLWASVVANAHGTGRCAGEGTVSHGYNHVEVPCAPESFGDSSGYAHMWVHDLPNEPISVSVGLMSPLVDAVPVSHPVCAGPPLDVFGIARGTDGDGYGAALCDKGAVERQYSGPRLGSISGTVHSDIDGSPIEGVRVYVAGACPCGTEAITDADGRYKVTRVSAGARGVRFDGAMAGYVGEFFDDSPTATGAEVLTLAEGQDLEGIDAGLQVAGAIRGRVVSDEDGSPLAGVSVTAYSATGTQVSWGISDDQGRYMAGGLPSGDYTLHFSSGGDYWWFDHEYYDDVSDAASATPVSVTAGTDVGLPDVGLRIWAQPGEVTGRVTTEDTGEPVAGVWVSIWNSEGFSASAYTDGNGRYVLSGVPEGSHHLQFFPVDENPHNLVREYWGDSYGFGGAELLDVPWAGGRTGINAALATGGSLSGQITRASDGSPVAGAAVRAAFDGYEQGVDADGDGRYELRGVPSGLNAVNVQAPLQNLVAISSPIEVVAGAEASFNASLVLGGSISGTVLHEQSGLPAAGVSVLATADGQASWVYASTDAEGNYTVVGLPEGDVVVCFSSPSHVAECFDGAPDPTSATPVPLVPGAVVAGIDASLAELAT